MLNLTQATNLREAILLSTLSERPVKIQFKEQPDGNMQRLLQLMQSIQTGCKVEVTPKQLIYIPGIITNNQSVPIEFDCGTERAIGYFLEPLIILSLFGKTELKITLSGFTNDHLDQSVDSIVNCLAPLIKKFAPDWVYQLKINRRGYRPNPTGKVYYNSNFVKYLKAVDIVSRGPIKRVRGVCSGVRVAPNFLNRLVSECRGVFNDFIPDVWIHTDFQKGVKGVEFSSGYAVSLVAESLENVFLAIDAELTDRETPEQIGETAALRLLDEIRNCGCVDTSNQQYALVLMAASEKRVSQLRLGRMSAHSVETLRMIRDFLGVTFQIINDDNVEKQQQEEDDDRSVEEKTHQTMIFQCLGSGLSNISREVQ